MRPLHDVDLGDELTFEDWIDLLVDLGEESWVAAQDGDMELAIESDEEARSQLAALRRSFPSSDQHALHATYGLAEDDVTIRGRVRRSVLGKIVELRLRELWQAVEYGGSRDPVDGLVTAMLTAVPANAQIAEDLGARLLVGQPYLGVVHENAVLGIVEQATDLPFLTDIAEGLLRTLWHNMESDGSRSSSHLSSLAMLLLESDNTSERRAAIAQLLCQDDPRYETIVIDYLIRTGDRALAGLASTIAATEFEPARALEFVTSLGTILGGDPQGHVFAAPITALVQRDPEFVRSSYAERLADNTTPSLRAAMVSGAGFQNADTELAQLAFDHDPAIDVRECALFVLTARADPEAAEQALLRALHDDSFNDHGRITSIASALGNLHRDGAHDAMRRVARQLRAHPGFDANAAAMLESVMRGGSGE